MKSSSLHRSMLCLGLIALAGCGNHGSKGAPPPPDVTVYTLHPQDAPLIQNLVGRLSAYRTADVRARVSGLLLKRTYDEGTDVKKGQLLYQIDPSVYRADLNTALGQLAQAQASYANYHQIAQRYRGLIAQHYISEVELETAEANERNAAAGVKAQQAAVDNARLKLGWTYVRAPIAGRAEQQQLTEGALVGDSSNDSGNSGTLLTTVDQIDPLYVNFNMPVTDLDHLLLGQTQGTMSLHDRRQTKVRLTLPDGTPIPQVATLDFSSVLTDAATGAVTLRAILPNPQHLFSPGQYVHLKANMGVQHHTFLIPQAGLQRDTQGAYVLVVGQDGKVARKDVASDSLVNGYWQVSSGLDDGDRIVVDGIQQAAPGSKVKPIEAAQGSSNAAAPARSASHP